MGNVVSWPRSVRDSLAHLVQGSLVTWTVIDESTTLFSTHGLLGFRYSDVFDEVRVVVLRLVVVTALQNVLIEVKATRRRRMRFSDLFLKKIVQNPCMRSRAFASLIS
jgi:hypothetical protein